MLDLAISMGSNEANATSIETNHGLRLKAPGWPQDCDFQLVTFNPSEEDCEVVCSEGLAEDIGRAIMALDSTTALNGQSPDWYRRLRRYAQETPSL